MRSGGFTIVAVLLVAILPHIQGQATSKLRFKTLSPFPSALETLQKQLGYVFVLFASWQRKMHHENYNFTSIDLLRRAVTHASFSEENNKALSILGGSVVETAVSFRLLSNDIDISAKVLNRRITESSFAVDGMRLNLHKVVRVSPGTNSSTPAVVCGAYRAILGAIAMDAKNSDDAGNIFWTVHFGEFRGAVVV